MTTRAKSAAPMLIRSLLPSRTPHDASAAAPSAHQAYRQTGGASAGMAISATAQHAASTLTHAAPPRSHAARVKGTPSATAHPTDRAPVDKRAAWSAQVRL